LTCVAQQNTEPVTIVFCVPHIPPCVIYSFIPIGKRLARKMENETRGYVFAWSHSLIHYLKISVKRQKIESRIRGNSPKFNNIKLICFIFFILYMGLNVYGRASFVMCVFISTCSQHSASRAHFTSFTLLASQYSRSHFFSHV